MNKTIKLLMISDIFMVTGFGLIAPILAIFIKENLVGGSIFAVGLASTIFLVTKSIVQLPFSRYIDSHKDRVKWLIVGSFMISFVPIIYIFTDSIKYIYLAQVFHGIGSGLAFPTWLGLFSTHLDKKHESYEWALYSTCVGLGMATTAALGSAMAQYVGFTYTFLCVSFLSLIGTIILFWLEKMNHKEKVKFSSYHKKRKLANPNNREFVA